MRGRVQGVYFRAATRVEALRLGLTGWVRNRDDGAVEICCEGERSRLDELVAWAHHGPPAARVDAVDVVFRDPSGVHTDFRIVD